MLAAISSDGATARPHKPKVKSRPAVALLIIVFGLAGLTLALIAAISIGARDIPFAVVWGAIFDFNPDLMDHQIIQEIRLPRVLAAAIVGASFAVSGAIMQGMTRNPLADSGLLGLNAGAGFMLAICFAFLPALPYGMIILFCFIGAGLGAMIVFGIGSLSMTGLTPLRLVLAGSAVSALLVAITEGISIYHRIGKDMAFWYAGGVAGTQMSHIKIMSPWIAGALIAALMLSRSITLLSLGSEVAVGLGQRTRFVRTIGSIVVLILAGASVSVAGGVAFVGLIVPHVTRYLVGVDYKWIIPCSAIFGALLLVLADLAARTVNGDQEFPLGALIALLGVPLFLYLARKEKREL